MIDYTSPFKHCPKCQTTKSIELFANDKNRPDGHDNRCKECRNGYNKSNRARLTQYSLEWMRKNPERARRYYHDHYIKHKEAIKKRREGDARRWVAANRERKYAANRNRRALQLSAEGTHTGADIKRQYKAQRGKCYYCHIKVGESYHVDHVVPLSRGGSNGPENIVIACVTCNTSKHDRLPHEWSQGGRLL